MKKGKHILTRPKGLRRAARRLITVMLSFMMVFTMIPWLAPEQSVAEAATLQPAMWFMDDLNITQVPGGDFSHKGTKNFDIVGVRNKNIKAPFDCKVVATFPTYDMGNTVVIQSTNKVLYADGSEKYLSMAFAHDNNISNCTVGKTFKQGAVICQNGNYGMVTGVHSHVTCMEGKYTDHPGLLRCAYLGINKKTGEAMYTWSFKKAIDPRNCLFLSSKTKVYNAKGMKFTTYKDTPADIKPTGSLESVDVFPGQITVKGWAIDNDKKDAALAVYVYLDSESGTCIGKGTANIKRSDLSSLGNINHGFNLNINTRSITPGKHKIYVKVTNINKSGGKVGYTLLKNSGAKTYNFLEYIEYKVITNDASDINNTSATINGSLDRTGMVSAWGFYLGDSEDDMELHKYTVSAVPVKSTSMSEGTDKYRKLLPGKRYFYKVWAYVNNSEKTGSTLQFKTSSKLPEMPVLNVASSSCEIGIGDSVSFSWKATDQTDYYMIHLYNEDDEEIAVSEQIYGTKYVFGSTLDENGVSTPIIQQDGIYSARIESYNAVGTKGLSEPETFVVNPNVEVTFVDADSFVDVDASYTPEVFCTIEVPWGHDAEAPTDPAHQGYTFKGWSEEAKNVTEKTTVKAVYEINNYNVKYIDSETGNTLKEETVDYYSLPDPPDYPVDEAHAKVGFKGWDKNVDEGITEDTTFYTCVGWYDDELPIYASITNAVREYDSSDSGDEGYTVTLHLRNWENGTSKGRAVVALKTREGKLLTSTESAAFSIKSGATKDLEVFVPYENAASIASVYVIGQYKDAIPISTGESSNNTDFEIDQSNTMTSWSTEEPPEGAKNVEQRVEYRYKDKQTTTSYSTSLAGYTQDGSKWEKTGSGTIDYVPSWPTGFNKSSAYYTKYAGNKPKTASETATTKTTVSTSTVLYLYWHWCRGYTGGPINRLISGTKEGSYTHWHSFNSKTPITYDSSAKAFYHKDASVCTDSYWWVATSETSSNQLEVKRCTYNTYKKLFNYYKWSDWSNWSTLAVTANDNRQVETRTVYRYQPEGMMDEDTSGELRTVTGNVDSSFAGKEATLFIYKVNEASDFTNEYVDQTVIGEDGSYTFNFKLREEPTIETGDFTVSLGIQGTSAPIYLETIEAPKKTYTVKYYDYDYDPTKDQDPIFETTVEEHGNAELPDESILIRDGYTFSNWSESNMNVTEDRILIAEYKINTYNVVFVDWQAKTVTVEEFEHGAALIAPQPEEPDEGKTVEWDAIADGIKTVTSDLVVTTRYIDKEYNVMVRDEEDTTLTDDKINYGMAVELPAMKDDSKKTFVGWENIAEGESEGLTDTIITNNAIICPVYLFNETVSDPTADLEQGVYDNKQTVRLTCPTDDALIYYTTDGSDPTDASAQLYTEPIEIDGPVELKFYATKAEMNDSEVQTRLYSVNYDGAVSKYMLEEELPEDVANNWSEYNVQMRTGYRYKDTREVKTLNEAASLEASGWGAESETEPVYDEYSSWSTELPSDMGDYINMDIQSEPVYETADQFTYSHYVYEDGVTKYSPTAVEGFDCTYEETEGFSEPLNIAGRDADGNKYFSYDGQIWYNQKQVSGQVQTGAKYRWRHQLVTYSKWSDWTTEKPGVDGQREYETADVFYYTRQNYYIVTVHFGKETWSYLAEEGSLVDIEDPNMNDENNDSYAYNVIGAYTDSGYSNEWNLENGKVTGSVEIFVKTDTKTFEVNFVDLNGDEISTQSVRYGESAQVPEVPDIEGYVFVGWDNDDYTSVKHDMYVHANYVPTDEYATVELDNSSLTLFKNKSAELTAIVSPLAKADAELTWTSSDGSVACVSDNGRVTALGAGTADITVKVNETGETAVCKITVKVDNATDLVLIKNDKLSIDNYGYLRGAKGNKDTVADILKYFDNANLGVVDASDETVESSALFGTGYKVQLIADGAVLDTIEAVVTGDLTCDGSINNKDVSFLLKHLADKVTPSPAQVLAGDANGDGEVWTRDAVLISRFLVGKAEF